MLIGSFNKSIYVILPILFISLLLTNNVFAQEGESFEESFKTAKEHSLNGEYRQSIAIYEENFKK